MSKEEFSPNIDHIINSLDGSVQGQGIKIGYRAWLDMGSKEFGETPDRIKAAAYQAAKVTDWADDALVDLMIEKHPHLSEHIVRYTIESLQEWAKEFPCEIEETKKDATKKRKTKTK